MHLQLLMYKQEVDVLAFNPMKVTENLKNFDVLKYWSNKLTTTMRPLAAQAIRVLTVPRSGAVIESSFSLVQLLQVGHRQPAQFSGTQGTRRLSLSAEQTQNEMLIRMNDHLIKEVHCMQ